MRTDILTENELNENSKMNLKMGYYETFTLNETALDRTYKQDIIIDGKHFNCIAHYIQYQKCQTWGLSKEICDYILHKYIADYPIKTDCEYIKFEDNFSYEYIAEIHSIPDQYRTKWRKICPMAATEAAFSAYEQCAAFKSALNNTKKALLIELSPSILWGIDTDGFSSETISNPINWKGENLYGQVLMAIRDKYHGSLLTRFKNIMAKRPK